MINISELLKRTDVKVGMAVFVLVILAIILISLLYKKDGFCRCNSIGSRVLCDEEHEKLKQLEGAL